MLGLTYRIAYSYVIPGVQILSDLATQINRVAGDNRLTEVVVEILLGIGIPRIEFSDTPVCQGFLLRYGRAPPSAYGRRAKRPRHYTPVVPSKSAGQSAASGLAEDREGKED